ncbi:MAG: insulinase family protein, partial [Bacteroidaceae bacterium]|nr:insulinase family protein [Bacteroidaceae bacterium]
MRRFLNQCISHVALLWAAWLVCVPLAAQSLTDSIKLPADIVEGRLPNGLRYLLKKNESPASRTEFRLIMHVGSVQESELQKGGAHFLEHIAFGGTKHFPNRSAVQYLESLGMKYGQDINAYTGFDRTVYMFAVPSDRQKADRFRKPLLILRDWLTDMTINPERVETEKGIILEELRGYDVGDDFYDLKIGQGIFRDRMPLGNTDDIRRMTAGTLR